MPSSARSTRSHSIPPPDAVALGFADGRIGIWRSLAELRGQAKVIAAAPREASQLDPAKPCPAEIEDELTMHVLMGQDSPLGANRGAPETDLLGKPKPLRQRGRLTVTGNTKLDDTTLTVDKVVTKVRGAYLAGLLRCLEDAGARGSADRGRTKRPDRPSKQVRLSRRAAFAHLEREQLAADAA